MIRYLVAIAMVSMMFAACVEAVPAPQSLLGGIFTGVGSILGGVSDAINGGNGRGPRPYNGGYNGGYGGYYGKSNYGGYGNTGYGSGYRRPYYG